MPKRISRYRKRLGQVFLRDPLVADSMIQSLHLASHETVLEIGPGRGALTDRLCQCVRTLYAIEIEARFVADLQHRFAHLPHVHIVRADARTYDYGHLPAPLVVVANLPYSMGMPILRRLFGFRQRLSRLLIMLQHEVAARLLAPPGTSAYSAGSIFFQYYADIHRCFEVSRHAFTPVPGVDSTVISLVPYTTLPWPSRHEHFFLSLVKSAFVHRRKTLRANLLAAPQFCLTRAQLEPLLRSLDLPPNVRPQELHVSQFVQLADLLHGLPGGREAPRGRELQQSS